MKIYWLSLCFICVPLLSSCLNLKPKISRLTGSENVSVFSEIDNTALDNCTYKETVEVVDGNVNSDQWQYQGTEDRAILRLQNEAIRLNGNAGVIQKHEYLVIPHGPTGNQIRLTGSIYMCK